MDGVQDIRQESGAATRIERGTCHVLFAHDIGLSVDLNVAERHITDTTQRQTMKHKRRAPRYFEYRPAPLRVTQEIEPLVLGDYRTATTVDLLIYDFGAVSVGYRIPLSGPLTGLLALGGELYDNPHLSADSRRRVEQLLTVIEPAIAKPGISDSVEDYAIYQIETWSPAVGLSRLIGQNGRLLAQILRAEVEPLSEQETSDALACRMSFGENDAVVMDWNAALLIDTSGDDVRAVLEYANVELLEMRNLDDQLDDALDKAYEAMTRRTWRRRLSLRARAHDLRRVAELQVDSALLFEGVDNALKLLGDQYLARVYRSASQRLHLNDWDASILRKLQTLESIYQKMSAHDAQQRMEVLEWIIILLIAVSIAIPFLPGLSGH